MIFSWSISSSSSFSDFDFLLDFFDLFAGCNTATSGSLNEPSLSFGAFLLGSPRNFFPTGSNCLTKLPGYLSSSTSFSTASTSLKTIDLVSDEWDPYKS